MKGPSAAPRTLSSGAGRHLSGLRADHLTISRLVLLPIPVAMLYQPETEWRIAALVLFVLLGLTDVWDGRLARRQGSSRFGEALDIVADRVFLIVVYGVFANLGIVPVVAFVLIAMREFLVGAVRALPTVEARTGKAGKWRTTAQMYGAGAILVLWIVVAPARPEAARAAILLLTGLILAVTVATAAAYLWKARSEIEAGVAGRPMELLGIAATALIVPILWAPMAAHRAALSVAAIALIACELAALLLASDLVPGRAGYHGRSERSVSRTFRRLSILGVLGIAIRLLDGIPGGASAAFAAALVADGWIAMGIVLWFRRPALA